MLTDNCVSGLTSACANNVQTSRLLWLSLSFTMHFSGQCLARGWTVTEPPHPVSCSVGGGGSCVRGFVVLGICGTRVRSSVCRTTLTVTTRLKGAGS